MTHEDAIILREELLFLIGQKGVGYQDHFVTDILIIPLNNPEDLSENSFVLYADINVNGESKLEDIALYSDRRAARS